MTVWHRRWKFRPEPCWSYVFVRRLMEPINWGSGTGFATAACDLRTACPQMFLFIFVLITCGFVSNCSLLHLWPGLPTNLEHDRTLQIVGRNGALPKNCHKYSEYPDNIVSLQPTQASGLNYSYVEELLKFHLDIKRFRTDRIILIVKTRLIHNINTTSRRNIKKCILSFVRHLCYLNF